MSSICWPWTSSSEVTFISSPKAVELHTASGSIGEHINGLRTHTWIIVELQPAGAQIVICNYWVHEQLWNSCVAICRQPLGYCSYIDIVAVWPAHAAGSSKQKVTKKTVVTNAIHLLHARNAKQTDTYTWALTLICKPRMWLKFGGSPFFATDDWHIKFARLAMV